MAKISAEQFSREGDKYLGRSYEEIDCQEFVERCMADAGLKMDLKGSNAWYREVLKHGWIGSPEQCKKKFGSIPKGALLFIHAYDGGEVKRGYHDDFGNASHIGIKTGRGKGAIHSSYTRGCVAESDFRDKTINGGWNTVGLYPKFTYGEKIDAMLEDKAGGGSGEDEDEKQEEDEVYKAIVRGGNPDAPINVRAKDSTSSKLVDTLPQGSVVTVVGEKGNWCKIEFANGKKNGWVLGEFVEVTDDDAPIADDSHIPAEDPDTFNGDDDWENEEITITISLTAKEAAYAVSVLNKIAEAIDGKIGRG